MARYFIHLSYCGTAYNGWQNQPHSGTKTIQGTIESVLSLLLRSEISIVGCGRTDTGVHASGYVAHLDTETIFDPEQLIYRANKLLPSDIAIHHIYPVDRSMHARFGAVSRSYQYHLHVVKSPFLPFSYYYVYEKPDISKLNEAASLLLAYKEFFPFCKLHSDVKTMVCHLKESYWIQEGDNYIYKVTSDRFLRGMIRLIVGMCLQVSRGQLSIDDVKLSLDTQARLHQDWSVPAIGLMLYDIRYESFPHNLSVD